MPNIMMDMNEERRRETTLNANLLLIRDKVDVLDLLDHLPCIHKMLRQKVECEFRNNGSHRAMEMLLNNLPGKDNWFEQLVSALRDLDEFELAEILDPCNTVQIIDHFSGVDQENIFQYPMKKAPYTLTSALKFMDYDGSWKEFAGHLGYTLEKIQKYEARPGKDGSHISRVMEHWCSNSDGTIGNIVCVLQKLERVDILENFSKILRIPLAQTEKKVTNDNDQQKNCSGPEESLTSSCKEDAIHEEQQIKAVKYSYHDFLSGNYDSGFDSMSSVDTNNPEKSLESLDTPHGTTLPF